MYFHTVKYIQKYVLYLQKCSHLCPAASWRRPQWTPSLCCPSPPPVSPPSTSFSCSSLSSPRPPSSSSSSSSLRSQGCRTVGWTWQVTAETLHLRCTLFVVFYIFTLKQNNNIKLNCDCSAIIKLTNLTVAFVNRLDVRISCDSCVKLQVQFSHTSTTGHHFDIDGYCDADRTHIYDKHQGFNFTELETVCQCLFTMNLQLDLYFLSFGPQTVNTVTSWLFTWCRGCCTVWSGCRWAGRHWRRSSSAWRHWWDTEGGTTGCSYGRTEWPAAPACTHTHTHTHAHNWLLVICFAVKHKEFWEDECLKKSAVKTPVTDL